MPLFEAGRVITDPLRIALVVLLLILALGATAELLNDLEEKSEIAGTVPSASPDSTGLIGRGWSEKLSVQAGSFRVWLSLENRSEGDVSDARVVDFRAPGFRKTGDCWVQGVPACREGENSPSQESGIIIPSGRIATLWAALEPVSSSGRFTLASRFRWRDSANRSHQDAVSIGPIQVTGLSGLWPVRLMKSVYTSLQSLALPIVALVLGWLFQRHSTKMADDIKKRDDRAASNRKLQEERKAQFHETWREMLSKNFEYSQKYYLPIMSALSDIERRCGDCEGPLWDSRKSAYYWLILLRRMRVLFLGGGGVFFKNIRGELLVRECWLFARDQIYRNLGGREKVQSLTILVEPFETLPEFVKRYDDATNPEMAEGLWRFEVALQAWAAAETYGSTMIALQVLNYVLVFEANRVLEWWYYPDSWSAPEDVEGARTLGDRLRQESEKFGPGTLQARTLAIADSLEAYLKQIGRTLARTSKEAADSEGGQGR